MGTGWSQQACVIPRPIGWISTISPPQDGPESESTPSTSTTTGTASLLSPSTTTEARRTANLAPFSQFNNLTFDPPMVMFSANQTPSNQHKDTVRNVEATGVFCWQLATWELREAVNVSAEQVPYGVDEFERAALEKVWSTVLKTPVPMVKASPVRFECEYHSTLRLPCNPPMGTVDIVIGKVVGIHIDDRVLTADGKIDVAKTQPIARCGYYDYAVIRDTFEMIIPGDIEAIRHGMEGSVSKHRAAREAANKMGVSESGPP
ncbi:hypothetical protein AYO20_10184 [Fonsecaea nubica]|uniref:Flavin reductase like domain-containing protein n=1 Tax=Fonsecaea nubica TaxID=856822 RepID=A0A178CBN7_9EURO|nr:hypothetical protein AYO20_10184 [Fonsecaea nubica]OAL26131.1 hypothetical protein AYO20_10184 [Fonsecaea nubica]